MISSEKFKLVLENIYHVLVHEHCIEKSVLVSLHWPLGGHYITPKTYF